MTKCSISRTTDICRGKPASGLIKENLPISSTKHVYLACKYAETVIKVLSTSRMQTCVSHTSEAGDAASVEKIVQGLNSPGLETKIAAIQLARTILCMEDPPVAALVQAGLVPPLLDALDRDNCPKLQYRALGLLSTVVFSSSKYTDIVANSAVLSKLISFLSCEGDLLERAVLMLGNLALHEAVAWRREVIHDLVTAILPYLRPQTPVRLLRVFLGTYNNFCCDCEDDELKLFAVSILPFICDLLDLVNNGYLDSEDKESLFIAKDVIVNACTVLANIMLGPDECVEAVQAVDGLIERLVALLGHEAPNIQGAALSAIGNMLAGTDDQVDRCLQTNCLEHIASLLKSSNSSLVAEAARATGNVFAGTREQIQQALDKDIMLSPLQNILINGDFECQKQAAYAVTNLICNGSVVHHQTLLMSGVVEPYCALLAHLKLAEEILNGLHRLIKIAEQDGDLKSLCYMLDELGVIDQMEILGRHVTDEDERCKIVYIRETLRKYSREERFVVQEDEVFTPQKIVRGLGSTHQETLSRAISATYTMLREQHPPINALVESGIVPTLVKGLDPDTCRDLHVLAVSVLCKFTERTGNHTTTVVNNGAIPKLLALLGCGDEIALLASCSLGYIALHGAHGPETRDAVLTFARSENGLTELRTFVEAYKYLCSLFSNDFDSMEKLEFLPRLLPFVSKLLDIGDDEITLKVCWACSQQMGNPYIPTLMVEVVQAVSGLTEHLVTLGSHDSAEVKEAALTAVMNMLAGTDIQVGRCIEAGCLDCIKTFLQSKDSSLIELALKAMRHIFGTTPSYIQQALDKDLLTPLKNILSDGDTRSQKQVALTIFYLCYHGSTKQRAHVISSGVLEAFCALLAATAPDLDVVDDLLDSLLQLLQDAAADNGNKLKALCTKLDQFGVIERLQQLQDLDSINESFYLKTLTVSAILRQQARGEHIIIEDGKLFTPADIVQDLESGDLASQTKAAAACLSLTSRDEHSRAAAVDAGVIVPLVAALSRSDCSDLQYRAAGVLANLTEGLYKHRMAVINSGAIPKLIALLPHGDLAGEAARTLGNLTWKAPVMTDFVLGQGAATAILPHMRPGVPARLLTKCAAAFVKFCSVIISPSLIELVSPALPYLSDLLTVENQEVQKSACKALGNIMHTRKESVETVQAVPGLTARLVALLGHEDSTVKQQALYAAVKMVSGTAKQADRCLDAGFLEHIESLLQSKEMSLLEQTVLSICNICVHTELQIQRVVKKDIITPIINILANAEPNSFLQYFTVVSLQYITRNGTHEHIMTIVDKGAIPELIDVLYHGAAVAERAAYTLANIAKDDAEARNMVLAHGAVRAVFSNVRRDSPRELLRSYMTVYENLCTDVTTASKFELVLPGLPFILQLIESDDQDEDVILLSCGAVCSLMKESYEGIEAIQAVPGLTARLVELLRHAVINVKMAAWNSILSMLQGNQIQIDRCVAAGCLDQIVSVMQTVQSIKFDDTLNMIIIMKRFNRYYKKHPDEENTLTSLQKLMSDTVTSSIPFIALSGLVHITSRGSIEHRLALVDARVTSRLSRLFSQEVQIAELAVVALGNIAGVSPEARDLVVTQGVVQNLLPLLQPDTPLELLWKASWAFRNICSSIPFDEPVDTLELLSSALPHLAELLNGTDEEVRRHVCWSMVSLSKTHLGREAVQAVPGLIPRLLALLGHGTGPVKKIVINVVLLLLSGTDDQGTRCIKGDCTEHMLRYLRSRERVLVAPAAAATRRILGEDSQQRALREDVLTPFMIVLDYEPEGRMRAVQAISKLWRLSSAAERARILYSGLLEPYCALLAIPDPTLTLEVLNSLEELVQIAVSDDILKSFCVQLDEIGIVDQMEKLREHENEEVNCKARRLLRTHFSKRSY